jgi:hypothetical protein
MRKAEQRERQEMRMSPPQRSEARKCKPRNRSR